MQMAPCFSYDNQQPFKDRFFKCASGFFLQQNKDNEAGIVHDGGLRPLLDLLDSKNGAVQHNASFALYGLADNEVRELCHCCRVTNRSIYSNTPAN